MTPIFKPYIETDQEIHERRVWTRRQAARYYATLRKEQATVTQVVDVRIRGPKCSDCEQSGPFYSGAFPQISASSWEEDVALEVGEDELESIRSALKDGQDRYWTCVRCRCALRPWDGDDVFIVSRFLDEDYYLESDTGPKQVPSQAMRDLVLEMYERRCFACGAHQSEVELTMDHIKPRSLGGNAASATCSPSANRVRRRKPPFPLRKSASITTCCSSTPATRMRAFSGEPVAGANGHRAHSPYHHEENAAELRPGGA